MWQNLACTGLLLLAANISSASDLKKTETILPSVRYITPPKLDSAHLGPRILCYRPMRQGSPRMALEQQDAQTLVHNYGHGGSGWTLAPGAAQYVVGLLEKEQANLDKNQAIAVVGAGTLGLFTALELHNRGFKNIEIRAESFENLTSDNAGGLLAPVSMSNEPDYQSLIDDIGIKAYTFYREVAKHKNPQVKRGARLVPTYFENREDSGLEPYVGKVMQPATDVIVDFKNGTRHKMVVYDDGIFIDTGYLMKSLRDYLKQTRGVTFKQGRVKNLQDLPQKIIFNCTGLNARKLAGDPKMLPVQGHLIMLRDQTPEDLEYMMLVYFGKSTSSTGLPMERSFYLFPKTAVGAKPRDLGVLGGTFIEGANEKTPHLEEFEHLLENARSFYGLHALPNKIKPAA